MICEIKNLKKERRVPMVLTLNLTKKEQNMKDPVLFLQSLHHHFDKVYKNHSVTTAYDGKKIMIWMKEITPRAEIATCVSGRERR